MGVVEWALWTILGPRSHLEEKGEGGGDLAGYKRQRTTTDVVIHRLVGTSLWAMWHLLGAH